MYSNMFQSCIWEALATHYVRHLTRAVLCCAPGRTLFPPLSSDTNPGQDLLIERASAHAMQYAYAVCSISSRIQYFFSWQVVSSAKESIPAQGLTKYDGPIHLCRRLQAALAIAIIVGLGPSAAPTRTGRTTSAGRTTPSGSSWSSSYEPQ